MCCFVLCSLGLLSILRSQCCFFLTSSHTRNRTKTHKITFTRLHTHSHPLSYTRIHSYTRIISPSLTASRTHAYKHPLYLFHAHTHSLFLSLYPFLCPPLMSPFLSSKLILLQFFSKLVLDRTQKDNLTTSTKWRRWLEPNSSCHTDFKSY